MNDIPSLFKEAMPIGKAAKYLKHDQFNIEMAVIQGLLPACIIAKGWEGIAIPETGIWEVHVCDIDHITNEYTYALIKPDNPREHCYQVKKLWAGNLWYLDHSEAFDVFTNGSKEIDWLKPATPISAFKDWEKVFPTPNCVVCLDSSNTISRLVKKDGVFFLKRDLDELNNASADHINPVSIVDTQRKPVEVAYEDMKLYERRAQKMAVAICKLLAEGNERPTKRQIFEKCKEITKEDKKLFNVIDFKGGFEDFWSSHERKAVYDPKRPNDK